MVYEPQEDSFLLKTLVRKHAKGKVLDVGTGSGIQAVTAYHKKNVTGVVGTDIDPEAIHYCKKHHKEKIKWKQGDLFEKIKDRFDTIIFNPPYLPQETKTRHIDLEGGKKGYEVIDRFLEQAGMYLDMDGKILLVFSSLTNKKHVEDKIKQSLFEYKELGQKRHFYEVLYVYALKKNRILKSLNKKGITQIQYFARGKRGIVYTGESKGKIAIKIKREDTEAKPIQKEAKWLKFFNKHGIGSQYLFHTQKYLVYRFVEGEYVKDLIGKRKLNNIVKNLLDKAFVMDKLNVNKEEMTRPLKHAIVKGNDVTLIDFERAHKTKDPKNVTQLCQFIRGISKNLSVRKAKIEKLAKQYSDEMSVENFNLIKKEL